MVSNKVVCFQDERNRPEELLGLMFWKFCIIVFQGWYLF